jgi:hypothetical protein
VRPPLLRNLSSRNLLRVQRQLSSHMLLSRHPLLLVLRNSRGVDVRLDRLRGRQQFLRAANRRCRTHARPFGLSVGVIGSSSQPVTQHSQNDLPDERDTRSAFPSHRSKVDFGAFVRECVEKNSIDFLARVIREACLRVQGNLETVVEFLLRPRRPGSLWITGSGRDRLKRITFSPASTRE